MQQESHTREEQFICELLAAAQESGIPEAEVYYHQSDSMRAFVNKGEIDNYTVSVSGGLSLRGLIDGKMGTAYTEALDKEALVMLIRGVLESATLVNDKDEQFIFPGSPSYAAVDTLGDRGTPQQHIDLTLALDKAGRGMDPRVQELGFTFVEAEHETVRIVNTHGLNLQHEADLCVAYVSAIARDGERVATGEAVEALPNLSGLQAEAVARRAVEYAVFQLDASSIPSGEMPVIFQHRAMADLLGAFLGMFSADAAQKGLSLLAGREGQAIASPCVTLTDDPLLAGGLYTRAFDAEGVATFAKNLVEGGVLTTLLHNLKTAKKAGIVTTANAARGGYAGPVGIAPTNLTLLPGTSDLAGLSEQMRRGLVITGVEGLHAGANAVSGDFSLLARGYVVEDGKPGHAVEQVTVAGNFYQLLQDIVATGSDIPPQTSRVRCPSVWVRSLSVAGQ